MKSKQELIEEWESAIESAEFYGKGKEERLISYMRDFVDDLNQLDEPDEREQLEIAYKDILERGEFWFDDKEYKVVPKQEEVEEGRVRLIVGFDGGTESYYATDVEDALDFLTDYDARFTVIKEPSIPKFVAEWYESEGKRSSWWNWFYKWGRDEGRTELETKTIRWMQDFNEEAFVNMFLHGYTVKKEQKYYVVNNDNRMMLVRMMDGKTITEADPFKLEDMYEGEKKSHRLTEQEIKDYDERYFAFAVKVEEMEE